MKMIDEQVGMVAQSKDPNSMMIEVHLTEQHPFYDGEILMEPDMYGKGQDQVILANTVSAEWYSGNSPNRVTPPDVRVGSKVKVFRSGNDGKYYWEMDNNETDLRAQERIVHAYNANKDHEEPSDENSYVEEIDTYNGLIRRTTSKANDEAYAYEEELNTAKGTSHFKDDNNNIAFTDSKKGIYRWSNTNGNFFELSENNFNIRVANEVNIQAKRMNLNIPRVYLNGSMQASGDFVAKSGVVGLTGHVHPGVKSGVATTRKGIGGRAI